MTSKRIDGLNYKAELFGHGPTPKGGVEMFKRRQIVEVLSPGNANNFNARIIRQCPHEGMGEWREATEIPADDERKAVLKRCARMGYGGFLAHQSSLRLLSN